MFRSFSTFFLLVVLTLSFAGGCSGADIMSEENLPSNTNPPNKDVPSIPELDEYIYSLDEYQAGIVPRRLDPELVARYLNGKVERDLAFRSFLRVESVADFYDIHEVTAKFKTFLDNREADDEALRRSASIARILARVGTSEEVEFARNYYKYLVGRADSVPVFEDLILLHEALGLGGASAEIRERLNAKAAGLAQRKNSDYRAKLEHRQFTGPLLQKLTRAEKVEGVKQQIIGKGSRPERIKEEIKAYLTIEYGYLEFLQPWAARRLRRETWANDPAQQVRRADDPALKADVIDQLKKFLAGLPGEGRDETQKAAGLRILRAIKFFGGEVSEEEETFLETNRKEQSDILANEGFMLEE